MNSIDVLTRLERDKLSPEAIGLLDALEKDPESRKNHFAEFGLKATLELGLAAQEKYKTCMADGGGKLYVLFWLKERLYFEAMSKKEFEEFFELEMPFDRWAHNGSIPGVFWTPNRKEMMEELDRCDKISEDDRFRLKQLVRYS